MGGASLFWLQAVLNSAIWRLEGVLGHLLRAPPVQKPSSHPCDPLTCVFLFKMLVFFKNQSLSLIHKSI